MKTLRPLTITRIIVSALLLFGLTNIGSSQASETTPSQFLILVETTTENGLRLIKLTCEKGCAWKDLSFTVKSGDSQAVDQYGMTTLNRDKLEDTEDLADFLFAVKRTQTGLNFQSKEGTYWIDLSFSCPENNCHQYIDQNGMTEKD